MSQNKKGSLISRLFGIAAQGKVPLLISCASSAAGTLSGFVPFLSVYFIARELLTEPSGSGSQGTILFWIMVAALGVLGNMLFSFLGSYGAHKVAFRLLYGFRIGVMEHIGKLSMGFFTDNTTGSVKKTMDDNIEKIEIFIAHLLPDMIGSACVLIALFTGLFALNLWLALATLLAIITAFAVQFLILGGKNGRAMWVELSAVSSKMTGAFSEYVKGIAEVKLFGLTGSVTAGLQDSIGNYKNWEVRIYKKTAPFYQGYKTIILSLLSFVLPVGTLLIALNPGDTGIMLAVLMALILTPAIYDPLMELVNYSNRMREISVSLDGIDKLMDMEPIPGVSNPKRPSSWDVEFRDVSFSYQDAADPMRTMALSHVSFTARQNQMTALVGPSGGGKSTVGQLISRFWDITGGSITIGGVDIREMDISYLMNHIAFVFQDTYIFADTLYNNIAMNRTVTKEQVETAAKAARCHDFILRLPQGYDTRVGSGGFGLSGGEAQRVAIARAMLKDSPIVVLDEALAYTDAENENLIQKAIDDLIAGKTVIIIAHRLPSIQNADQILVLDKGEIMERGTHEFLLETGSLYPELWHIQTQADDWAIETEAAAI